MSRTDTASGKGGGRLTENPAPADPEGGIRPKDEKPAPFTHEVREEQSQTKPESDQG